MTAAHLPSQQPGDLEVVMFVSGTRVVVVLPGSPLAEF